MSKPKDPCAAACREIVNLTRPWAGQDPDTASPEDRFIAKLRGIADGALSALRQAKIDSTEKKDARS